MAIKTVRRPVLSKLFEKGTSAALLLQEDPIRSVSGSLHGSCKLGKPHNAVQGSSLTRSCCQAVCDWKHFWGERSHCRQTALNPAGARPRRL